LTVGGQQMANLHRDVRCWPCLGKMWSSFAGPLLLLRSGPTGLRTSTPYLFKVVVIWSLILALHVGDHALVFARSRSVVVFQGISGGCCDNCKWRDHASRCSVRDDMIMVILSDEDENPEAGANAILGASSRKGALNGL
jgi:hypothetical protein